MATAITKIITLVDQNIGDTSTTSVSAADRRKAISSAVKELYNEFPFDFTKKTYEFDYFDTINWYNITANVPGFAEPVDLRRREGKHTEQFTRKSPRELAEEVDNGVGENALAIELKDRKTWLIVNYQSENPKNVIHNCDSTAVANEIQYDGTTSDASNLTIDKGEYLEGSGSVNFDLTVGQSVNQKMSITFNLNSTIDMTKDENVSSFIFDTYLPDVTGTSSTVFVASWGQNSSNYWSATVTTDIDGATVIDGWNRIKVDWTDATKTGSPNISKIAWAKIDINHNSASNDTDFRIDDIRMVKPEKLTLHYNTFYVGVSATSSAEMITDFYDNTNVPFYSGIYDYFDTYVAYKSSAILFRQMGMLNESNDQELLASRELQKLKKKFPIHRLSETSNFKVKSISWK